MNEKAEALKARTKKFALDVLDLVDGFPTHGSAVRIGNQLAGAATSVAANYRASCRACSKAEFAAKIGVVLEESDESLFWLEVSEARRFGQPEKRQQLTREAGELTAIFAQSSITARSSV